MAPGVWPTTTEVRSHASLKGHTPLTFAGGQMVARAELNNVSQVSPYGATKRPRLVWLLAGRPLMPRVASPAGRHAGYAPDFVFNSASCSVRNARISSVRTQ